MPNISRKTRVALSAALGIMIVGGGTAGVLSAQAHKAGLESSEGERSEKDERAPYRSSIQVADDEANEVDSDEADSDAAGEQDEAGENGAEDRAATAKLQSLARISLAEARSAALLQVPGTVTAAGIENEDGNLVYGITVKTAAGEQDVKVDAGNGTVLHVEKGGDTD